MKTLRFIVGLGAVLALAPACAGDGVVSPDVADPAVAFENLEVASDFTFATRQDVRLRLEATEPGQAKYVEVSDAEGRRLFAGGVRESVDLELALPKGSASTVNLRVGRGDAAVTRAVDVAGARAVASF